MKKSEIDSLNLWVGDKIFFKLMDEDSAFFSLKLQYRGDSLEAAVVDGTPMDWKEYLGIK